MDTLTTIDVNFSAALRHEVVADPTSDHALLEATRIGDEDAFAELVGRYRNPITNYIYRMTNDYDGAVDLAQETFVRVYRAADRYQTTYAFSTYIYRIATNLAISELRKRKRRKLVSLTGFFQARDGGEPQEFNPPDLKPLPDTELVDDGTSQCSAASNLYASGEVPGAAHTCATLKARVTRIFRAFWERARGQSSLASAEREGFCERR